MKKRDFADNIRDLLIRCLRAVPHVRNVDWEIGDADSSADLTINVSTDQAVHQLGVAIRGSGQPRYAREAVALLSLELGRSSRSSYPVFTAPHISRSAAEICLEAGAGYMDLAGNCRIAFNGIYIERQGQPNKFASSRSLRSLYQARSSRVLRALLFNPNLTWKLSDLSEAAGVSIGQVFNVKNVLIDREWAVFDKNGLKLIQPEQVLRDWGAHYQFQKNTLFDFRSSATPPEMESKLADRFSDEGLRYAFTAFSASNRLVPATSYTRVFAYVDSNIEHIAALLDLKPTDSEPAVTFMLPHDDGVFYGMKEILGAYTVSSIQAYLDLIGLKGTGKEAAEALLRQIIQKEWQPDGFEAAK